MNDTEPNMVTLSDDRREMTITSGRHTATLRSARAEGFTDDDVDYAHTFTFSSSIEPNQVNRARRIRIGSRVVYAHCNVGPPTWWLPRVDVKRGKVMVGWLRILFAISWDAS